MPLSLPRPAPEAAVDRFNHQPEFFNLYLKKSSGDYPNHYVINILAKIFICSYRESKLWFLDQKTQAMPKHLQEREWNFKVGIVTSKKRWESDIYLFQRQPIGEWNQIKMHGYAKP